MPLTQITIKTIGMMYLTVTVHHFPIFIIQVFAFRNSINLSVLNSYAKITHSINTEITSEILLTNSSVTVTKTSAGEVVYIIDSVHPTMHKFVTALFLVKLNLF